jgi:hypothetical protein
MKLVRNQLEFELQTPKQCRSPRRAKKANPARLWFEKMRQVVDDASERPLPPAFETPDLLGK